MKKAALGLLILTLLSFAFTTPKQITTTALRVTVLDDAGNIQEGAKVTLYKTQEDFEKEQNPVSAAQTTSNKGFVIFRSLEPKIYYVAVSKGDLDNSGGSTQTQELKSGAVNKVNIIIE
ncbi:carboxypeptidase regulatory-like domain-containing protein [Cytophagaceae bacterium YF14B1]|uniref:Carboxypeptidase regulatory-like domain-containing protein n=1 Tax=Xanthocytophaga flava TaxID=3048013 RepID=A0AAE3QUJ1_9BACT|nr:carboxypeptidase regulatory-like domain-containing protein [Xanthocytophaga flavus]MDJ1485662.1 carboxypeptidase regulatory-like domain-containing protein [Xanthocytophaga flavus]